jgi:excisionase family DNA binding protein
MCIYNTSFGDEEPPSGTRAGRTIAPNLAPLGVPPKQAWQVLGCSNSTGYELLAAGELESYTIGRARRITVESIRGYVARRRGGGTAPSPRRRGRPPRRAAEAQT